MAGTTPPAKSEVRLPTRGIVTMLGELEQWDAALLAEAGTGLRQLWAHPKDCGRVRHKGTLMLIVKDKVTNT